MADPTDVTITYKGQKARILNAETMRLGKQPQDLLANSNLTSIVYDAAQAAFWRMGQRVNAGEIEYPEDVVLAIEENANFAASQRALQAQTAAGTGAATT